MSSSWSSTLSSGREPPPTGARRTSVAVNANRNSVSSVSTLDSIRKGSTTPARARAQESWWFGKARVICLAISISVVGVIAAIIVVSFLTSRRTSDPVTGQFWRPQNGVTWQIEISNPLTDTSIDAEVYDIDLYSNGPDIITTLHNLGRKVICYFSAGTYDPTRPDHAMFQASDYGNMVDSSTGKRWLDTQSSNVRSMMAAHLDMAAHKGCDGVDPDNTDAYLHNPGFPLTEDTTMDYLRFLATESHARNLSIGLKNNGPLVNQTVNIMQWEVNEVCEMFNDCDLYQPFIAAGKPVFHIIYSGNESSIAEKDQYCSEGSTNGFSTILKNFVLDNWISTC